MRRTKSSVNHAANRLNLYYDSWTISECEILKQYYNTERQKVQKRLPNHSLTSIYSKAAKLGLKANRWWTMEEDNILKESKSILEVINKLPNRSKRSITRRISELNLTQKFYTELSWSEQELNTIKQYYPNYGAQYCQKYLPNRTVAAITIVANRKLHLKHIKKMKQIYCLENNKFYASAQAASTDLNISVNLIYKCCNHQRKDINGYHFWYKNE